MATPQRINEDQTEMKKHFVLFFILFSVNALSAQNLNFMDTNGLKTLLCSKTWIMYYLNTDSSFSNKIEDSIKFNDNGTWVQYARPKDDSMNEYLYPILVKGTWKIGPTAKTSRSDTATDCININVIINFAKGIGIDEYILVDGHRIKGSKNGRNSGNLAEPFLIDFGVRKNLGWDRRYIWQPRREFKKAKKH